MRREADGGTDEWRRTYQPIPHSCVYQGKGGQQQVANVPTTRCVIIAVVDDNVIVVDAIDVMVAVVVIFVVIVEAAMSNAICCVYMWYQGVRVSVSWVILWGRSLFYFVTDLCERGGTEGRVSACHQAQRRSRTI